MVILSGQMKALALAVLLLPGTSIRAAETDSVPAPSLKVECPAVVPFDALDDFYRRQTRDQLSTLGAQGDPVGLFYLSSVDLKAGRETAAKAKLERAAEQGLRAAFLRLAKLAETEEERHAALACAAKLLISTERD